MKIAIFGKIRSGKDTLGKILIDEYGFTKKAFAEGIGEIIEKYFPDAFKGGKPRQHYQVIGQALRTLDPNVWVNYLLNNIKNLKCENIVITDGRQLNEAKRLKEEGFLIVKVTADEELRLKRMQQLGDVFNEEALQHETELNVDLIEPDIEIFNNESIEHLREAANKIVGGNFNDFQ